MPNDGDQVTQEEVSGAVNIGSFSGAKPDPAKGWHKGQFEPWTMEFGYKDGMALYGGALHSEEKVHIYYLPVKEKTILLKLGETPQTYKITP
jgi:hypothetical protein